jgi:hypothetical protein
MDEMYKKSRPEINMSRISVAGIPGLVFALGFIWMFWFGVPAYRPLVIATGALGLIAAVFFIVWRSRRVRRGRGDVLRLKERS